MKQSTKLLITGIVLFVLAGLFLDPSLLQDMKKAIGVLCALSACIVITAALFKYIVND